jgi:hypothetical protein
VPAGGSVAALSGAGSAALLVLVCDVLELARGLRGDYLPRVPIPSSEVQHVRELFAARDTLNKMATQCKNLGHAALARNGLTSAEVVFPTPPLLWATATTSGTGIAD